MSINHVPLMFQGRYNGLPWTYLGVFTNNIRVVSVLLCHRKTSSRSRRATNPLYHGIKYTPYLVFAAATFISQSTCVVLVSESNEYFSRWLSLVLVNGSSPGSYTMFCSVSTGYWFALPRTHLGGLTNNTRVLQYCVTARQLVGQGVLLTGETKLWSGMI